jgi:hypothetical protein
VSDILYPWLGRLYLSAALLVLGLVAAALCLIDHWRT